MLGCVTTEENGFDRFLGNDGRKSVSVSDSRGNYFTICDERLFARWYGPGLANKLLWQSQVTRLDQCLTATILSVRQI